MTMARSRYQRRFARRSNRSRSQDLARQARVTVSASETSKRARGLLARWERAPNQLDVRGVDTRRRRSSRMRRAAQPRRRSATTRTRVRMPAAVDTPPPMRKRAVPRRSVAGPKMRRTGEVQFTPAPGVPKQTTKLIREYLKAVQSGKSIPKTLSERARKDPFLADKGIKLTPPGRLLPPVEARASPQRSDAPRPAPPSRDDIVVKADGEEVTDWLSMSAAERRKLMRSPMAMRKHAEKHKGTEARKAKAEAWRDLRKFRTQLTPEAYRQAQDAMRAVLAQYAEDGPMTATPEKRREALGTIRKHFAEEMKRRHPDFSPEWGRRQRSRRGTL